LGKKVKGLQPVEKYMRVRSISVMVWGGAEGKGGRKEGMDDGVT
jgi:hypothetical protein